ncbi:hypothetical protein [Candidatus Glomeribacter gigasporarum]|uniref:hypothetical protein n=1 Tax=Candidatus Glomeribacter gigasporarum TaxID=132144 RepID=UPI0013153CDF|nr:hypothetical protein [Candidatus Glomeribacter gigasporarum]
MMTSYWYRKSHVITNEAKLEAEQNKSLGDSLYTWAKSQFFCGRHYPVSEDAWPEAQPEEERSLIRGGLRTSYGSFFSSRLFRRNREENQNLLANPSPSINTPSNSGSR